MQNITKTEPKDNGGAGELYEHLPAFPHGPLGDSIYHEDGRVSHQMDGNPGMALRDYFAAKALQGIVESGEYTKRESDANYPAAYARMSYEFADAMLEARKAKE